MGSVPHALVESKFSEACIPATAKLRRVSKAISVVRKKYDDLSRIVVLSMELAVRHLKIV